MNGYSFFFFNNFFISYLESKHDTNCEEVSQRKTALYRDHARPGLPTKTTPYDSHRSDSG